MSIDVLLVQPPIRDFYLTSKRTMPMGLAAIAAALEADGFSVAVFDALATSKSRRIEVPEAMGYLDTHYGRPDRSPFALFHGFRHFGYSFAHMERMARQSGAWLVGISALFTAYADAALEAATTIRRALPTAVIVMGGHHPTALPEAVLDHPAVDFVVRGDGEIGMPTLAHALSTKGDFRSVPGIAFRDSNRGITVHPPAVAESLDRLPLPALHHLDSKYYRRNGRGSVTLVASRGCPMQCSYCCMGAGSDTPYRRRGADHVMAELVDAIGRFDARFVDFEDEHLALDRTWLVELLDGIRERFGDRLELRAMNGLFPPSLDEALVDRMHRTGFRALNLSVGSMDPATLARFRRPDVRRDFDAALAWAAARGMSAVGYIIVGAPDQDPTASVADLLAMAGRRTLAGVSVYYPAPGSRDFEDCRKAGNLPAEPGLMRATAIPVDGTTSRLQSVTLLRLGRMVNFMKSVIDQGLPLPEPRPLAPDRCLDPTDRFGMGVELLAAFLDDGKIRGVLPDGGVYSHRTDPEVIQWFRSGLAKIRVRGVQENVEATATVGSNG